MSEDAMKTEEEEEEVTGNGGVLTGTVGRRDDDSEGSTSLWLITFTDIMALMLTFFVLLYSMSAPEEEQWDSVTKGITNQITKTYSAPQSAGQQREINISKIDFSKAQSLQYLNSVLGNAIEKDEALKNITLIQQEDSLIVSIPEDLLFDSGQTDVSTNGKQVLYALGNSLARIRNRVEVIGHTDPRPVQNTSNIYASNWELSLARAAGVSAILENAGYNRTVIVRGLSSSRYDDLPEDMSEEERLSYARRVDIEIMPDDGTERSLSFEVDILQ